MTIFKSCYLYFIYIFKTINYNRFNLKFKLINTIAYYVSIIMLIRFYLSSKNYSFVFNVYQYSPNGRGHGFYSSFIYS